MKDFDAWVEGGVMILDVNCADRFGLQGTLTLKYG